MAFIFTTPTSRQSHMKHSPSLTLERGESRLRSPKPLRTNERTSFYTNADTGIDFDGQLKSGYRSGDIQSLSPSPEATTHSFELSSMRQSSSGTLHLRPSPTSPIGHAFAGQPGFRPMSRNSSFDADRELEERETLRRRRMRKAGGNVYCGTVTALLAVMAVCLTVMLLVYLKIR